ncbi:MAG: hypothetical protein DMF94_34705 [Acidobacteria bacterium]|nr:MAG: hypothetical protein DMF94_34705 [Acidobacteriota bacterium]
MDMETTRMNALKWWISLAIVLCIALPASLAFAQAAGLAAVGAPDPAHGFPKWYLDKNGLQLAPCLDAGAADPCGLIAAAALPNPALPVVFPTNFPNEVFYNRATSRIDGIGGRLRRGDGYGRRWSRGGSGVRAFADPCERRPRAGRFVHGDVSLREPDLRGDRGGHDQFHQQPGLPCGSAGV